MRRQCPQRGEQQFHGLLQLPGEVRDIRRRLLRFAGPPGRPVRPRADVVDGAVDSLHRMGGCQDNA